MTKQRAPYGDLVTDAMLDAVAELLAKEARAELVALRERVAELEAALAATEAERRALAERLGIVESDEG